jgi:RNA polymerase sigma factor (sigma-70 family)
LQTHERAPMPPDESDWREDSPFGELYRRHARGLFAYALQQTASREDAEDLVLDAFLSALQNPRFPSFDEGKQEAWLWAVTRNKVADYHRRGARRQHVPIEWLAELLREDDHLAPEQLSLQHEAHARLTEAIRALPALQQEILRLRFGHGLKCRDIAAIVNKNEGAVRITLMRTLQRLRAIYIDQETEASDGRAAAPLRARGD